MNKSIKAETAQKALKEAVAIAMEKYKKLGINAVFSKDDKLYYMTPEGKEVSVEEEGNV